MDILEDRELTLKRYEELYALAKSEFVSEIQRFDAIEQKTTRYSTLLLVLLGIGSVGLDRFAQLTAGPHGLLSWAFLGFYMTAFLCAVTAQLLFLRALSVQFVPAPPAGQRLVQHFVTNRYIDAIFSLAMRYTAETSQLREILGRKARGAVIGYGFMLATLAFGVAGGLTYVSLRVEWMSMKPKQARGTLPPDTQQPSEVEPSVSRPRSDVEPNPEVEAPPFEEVQRGIEGGFRRRKKEDGTGGK